MKATAKDLRFNSKKLLDTVNRGEEIIITFRGRPCAKLIPYAEKNEETIKNRLFGMWKDNEKVQDVDKFVQGRRKGRF
jgi:prevent-host-death family protein